MEVVGYIVFVLGSSLLMPITAVILFPVFVLFGGLINLVPPREHFAVALSIFSGIVWAGAHLLFAWMSQALFACDKVWLISIGAFLLFWGAWAVKINKGIVGFAAITAYVVLGLWLLPS
jgi:hypothetical protein